MAGKLFATGLNGNGQLGLGDTTQRTTLEQVGTDEDWVFVAATQYRTFAIKSDGTLWSCGSNAYGQLGLGDTTQRTSLVKVGAATNWVQGSAGTDHAAFVRADGTLWTWGWNGNGQLGLGDTTQRNSPVQVGSATNWASVACGDDFTVATRTDGTLWTWGNGANYRTGHGDTTQRTAPAQVGSVTTWASVRAGIDFGLALRTDGSLWVWGNNNLYKLGLSDTTPRTVPTQARSGDAFIAIASGPGAEHALAVRDDYTLWAAGNNGGGTYGIGDTSTYTVWTQSGADTDWEKVYANGICSLMIRASGTLWGAGNNASGQFSTGDTASPKTSPVQLGSTSNWAMVGAGKTHTVALTEIPAGLTYTAEAPVTFDVSTPVRAEAPITFRVGTGGNRATAPVSIEVSAPVRAAAPVTILVGGLYRAAAPATFVVFDPAQEIGRGWCALRVRLAGEDVSDRIMGDYSVEAEEGSARVAEFSLRPVAGPVSPTAWLAQPVTIDFVQDGLVWRIFTGIVSRPEIDVVRGRVRFFCTDNLQRIVDALTRADIDALTPGGYWSRFIWSPDAQGWDYLQNRRETVRAEVDMSPWGDIRATPWLAGATEKTFTAADILDRTPQVGLTHADQLVNRVTIELGVSLPVLRAGRMLVGWTYGGAAAPLFSGRPFYAPDIETVQAAFDGLGEGWETTRLLLTPVSGGDTGHVRSVAATLTRRWVQDHVWRYSLEIAAPDSIAAYGDLPARETGNLAYRYDEPRWTEDGVVVQDSDADTDPDQEIERAVLTLLGIGWRRILGTHRDNQVTITLPLDPSLDLAHTYAVATASVQAVGKARRVRFEGDLAKGRHRAILTLSISGVGFAGGEYAEAPLAAPARPAADPDPVLAGPLMHTQVMVWPPAFMTTPPSPDWDLDGWSAELHASVSGSAPSYEGQITVDAAGRITSSTGTLNDNVRTITSITYRLMRGEFKITAPADDPAYIDAREIAVAESYSVEIPEDTLTQTFMEAL